MGMMRLGVELKARSIEVSPPSTDGPISSTKKAFMGLVMKMSRIFERGWGIERPAPIQGS
jgi:hypothetical protein